MGLYRVLNILLMIVRMTAPFASGMLTLGFESPSHKHNKVVRGLFYYNTVLVLLLQILKDTAPIQQWLRAHLLTELSINW